MISAKDGCYGKRSASAAFSGTDGFFDPKGYCFPDLLSRLLMQQNRSATAVRESTIFFLNAVFGLATIEYHSSKTERISATVRFGGGYLVWAGCMVFYQQPVRRCSRLRTC